MDYGVSIDRKDSAAGKKCKGLRVAATEVMQDREFKAYCQSILGTAPNDFLAHECAKVTASISEAAVKTLY